MFYTELEVVENGFLLIVRYKYRVKKWTYRTYEEIAMLRSKIEGYFVDEEIETLDEVMI
jgi:hypothetical protein